MIEIQRKGFSAIIPDNEQTYYNYLQAIIESVDGDGSMLITKGINSVNFRIAPSKPIYLNPLIQEINKVNTMFKLHVEYSKSIKSTYVINFSIKF